MTFRRAPDLADIRMMGRDAFITSHVAHCQAGPCRKYDRSKPNGGGYHSLDYSRRKCAKNLWRKAARAGMREAR